MLSVVSILPAAECSCWLCWIGETIQDSAVRSYYRLIEDLKRFLTIAMVVSVSLVGLCGNDHITGEILRGHA